MRTTRLLPALLFASSLVALLTVGCVGEIGADDPAPIGANPLAGGADFVAIPRLGDGEGASQRRAHLARGGPELQAASEDFYLAIKKSVPEDCWFLTASLAERTLGTRVVSFQVQNGKLYVVDAADPALLVEAYPIVSGVPSFEVLPGAEEYLLVDPAAGLNRFEVSTDVLAGASASVRFVTELTWLQGFRELADGAAWQEVFTGYADGTVGDGLFRASGTLSMSLRQYREGTGFVPRDAGETPFFLTESARVNRWNVHPGMEPIEWSISPALGAYVDAHPELQGVDVAGAVARGLESWNDAFGFEALRVSVADAGEALDDDAANQLRFDSGAGAGLAYARVRTNPYTGEIGGADIVLGADWLAAGGFLADAVAPPPGTPPAPRAALVGLTWAGMAAHDPLCVQSDAEAKAHPGHAVETGATLSGAQKLEAYITHAVAHQVGHTLGLRHNFAGSLAALSVMDDLPVAERVTTARPGAYDLDAVRFLYDLSATPPGGTFCTEGGTTTDPYCARFDGANPLGGTWARDYGDFLGYALAQGLVDRAGFDYAADGLLRLVRRGVSDEAEYAYELVAGPLRAPLGGAWATSAYGPQTADWMARTLVEILMLDGSDYATMTAPVSPAVHPRLLTDVRALLLDSAGLRSFETRRACVDALKRDQSTAAYQILLEATEVLANRLQNGGLSPETKALTRDLQSRVQAALSPYFD